MTDTAVTLSVCVCVVIGENNNHHKAMVSITHFPKRTHKGLFNKPQQLSVCTMVVRVCVCVLVIATEGAITVSVPRHRE